MCLQVTDFRVKLNNKLSPKRSPVVTGSLEFTWLVVGIILALSSIQWPGNPQLTFGHRVINNNYWRDEARSVSPSSDDIRLLMLAVWFVVSWKCTNKVKQSNKWTKRPTKVHIHRTCVLLWQDKYLCLHCNYYIWYYGIIYFVTTLFEAEKENRV